MIEITSSQNQVDVTAAPVAIDSVNQSEPIIVGSQPDHKKWLWILMIVLLIMLLSAAYWLGSQNQNKSSLSTTESGSIVPSPNESEVESSSTLGGTAYERTELLFMKSIEVQGDETDFNYQAWLVDLADNQQRLLELPSLAFALKRATSPKVFFTQLGNENIVYVKDVVTNDIQRYEVITHPNDEVREGVTLNNINSISPDGSMFIYSVFFTEPCPPVTFEPGFEGGFGPCEPEFDPNFPAGYYLYDIATGENTHLGMSVLVSTWDLPNDKLYFNDIDGTRGLQVLDLRSKQATFFDKTEFFGYGAFPLLSSNLLIKIEGQTGDQSGQNSSVALSLTDLSSGVRTVLDSGPWASIQPFASIAPDESKFIYVRTHRDDQGNSKEGLYLYDLRSKQLRQLTAASLVNSYSIYGYWLDNDHFITTMNESGVSPNFDNTKNSLVKIDVRTGAISKLIDGSVYRFHIN